MSCAPVILVPRSPGILVIPQGLPGLSAYEIAVAHGFEGTEEEWLESLQGVADELTIAVITGLQAALDAKLAASVATAFALTLLDDLDADAMRTTLGLGAAAIRDVGTTLGTVAAGDHTHTGLSVQAAGTPSVRSLGTSSTEAAPGDHSHAGFIAKGTDGSGSNAAGTATTVPPGRSTGNASPAGVILQTTIAGVSGATIQTAYDTVEAVNGMLIVRQPGGTVGIDEGRFYDTGTVLVVERMPESGSTDAIALRLNSVNVVAARRAQGGWCIRSGNWLTWASDPATAVPTSGINQEGVGLLAVIDGTNSANYRDLKARDLIATRAVRLASTTVAALPAAGTAGRVAYASNGRRSGEGAGAGTGCPVWDDGTNWKTFYDNTTVQA